jgi:uncharacterized damage-inducible protein DinB
MQEKSEGLILSEVFEDVRSLTKFYLSLANPVDPRREYAFEGRKLNSLYWITGHLAWAEHYLLVEAMTGEKMDIPWLDEFDMGSELQTQAKLPTVEEIHIAMDQVHERAMSNVRSFTDDELDTPNLAGIAFRAGNARRVIIRHAIRHEPCHTGQIGWILKMNGLETV